MSARSTMSNLITTLRGMTNAGTADWTIGSLTYWSDDQLQTTLDRYRVEVIDEPLEAVGQMVGGGTISFYEYRSRNQFYEATNGGTAQFVIRDAIGSVSGTANWSADYERGAVTFTADQKGICYFLSGWSYDLNAAAADIMWQKTARAAEMISFSTSGHSVNRSKVVDNLERQARMFEAKTSRFNSSASAARGDMYGCWSDPD